MIRHASLTLAILILMLDGFSERAEAQPPVPPFAKQSDSSDNEIDGSIWQYKATLKSEKVAGGEEEIEGKLRLEGDAVFDVSSRFKIPARSEIKEDVVDPLIRGEEIELRLPEGPQQKRLGEYHVISKSRIRINFDDPESLHGIMIISRKKKTSDVWGGTYKVREGKRTVREYVVELKRLES